MQTLTKTMKAMTIIDFGDTSVFKKSEMPKPDLKNAETCHGKSILVKVYATSANPVDYKIRKGLFGDMFKPPVILGFDVSGIVEAVGDKVTDLKCGDEVYYMPRINGTPGAYAEYHLAEEEIISKKPRNISHEEAASFPLACGTAWDALIDRTKIKIGETILIHAGAGGVGSYAIQLAKLCGCFVYTTCSPKNFDLVKKLGADKVIDYKKEDFVEVIRKETNNKGVDVIFDTVGGETLTKSIDAAKSFGRIASIVRVGASLEKAYLKNISLHFVFVQSNRQKMDIIRDLIERGQLKPVIDSVLPLQDASKAHEKLEAGGARGKIVLKVAISQESNKY